MRLYLRQNVLEVAEERIRWVFSRYLTVFVSVSGGKDSTALFELTYRIARELGREVNAFFLDQEAEYAATIEIVRGLLARPGVVPWWYQVPIWMTSAASSEQDMLHAWGAGEAWMRAKDPLAIHQIDEPYPDRFYPFIDWFERRWPASTCFLVGQRAEESHNRLRAVIKHPGVEGVLWSTKGAGNVMKLYPLYDWSFDDIFLFFHLFNIPYNRVYDFLHVKDPGAQIRSYRVSNLIHERAYRGLATLQEFEPETYEALTRRLKGARTAARYAGEGSVYEARRRPKAFATWAAYRNHLLALAPAARAEVYRARFANQAEDERVARAQCRSLLVGDWEGNLQIAGAKKGAEEAAGPGWKDRWWDLL